ncbi:hypothetical protein SRABI04_02789 [Chryseobacterium sp. Bi04]|nr:hypothetical protein SRABI04_02789 [Chryseobacterium sp. Bi04]
MMKNLIHTLLILVTFHINDFAQTPKSYTVTHIVNKTIDKGEYVDDKRIDKLFFKYDELCVSKKK